MLAEAHLVQHAMILEGSTRKPGEAANSDNDPTAAPEEQNPQESSRPLFCHPWVPGGFWGCGRAPCSAALQAFDSQPVVPTLPGRAWRRSCRYPPQAVCLHTEGSQWSRQMPSLATSIIRPIWRGCVRDCHNSDTGSKVICHPAAGDRRLAPPT